MRSYVRSRIDERVQALVCMENGCKDLPDYTLGDILYTALRKVSRANGGDIRFLRRVDTKTLLRCIEQSLEEEIKNDEGEE